MSESKVGKQGGDGGDKATEFTPITSQDDLNRVVGERVARERAKFSDYDELKAAADRLAEIEEANKSEDQKRADAVAAAEARASEAEAKALRREVALEHSLTADDAVLLDAITDETAMRSLAERLAKPATDKPSNSAPNVGTGTPPAVDERMAFANRLVGRTN